MAKKNSNQEKIETTFAQAIAGINKRFGANSIIRLKDKVRIKTEVIPTSITMLNVALGVGGVPQGRIIEVYGEESSGKTTLCLDILSNGQKMGLTGAFVDTEHSLDPEWAETLGADTDELFVAQPECAEDALEIVDALVDAKTGIIIVDSVAGLVPRAEIDGSMGDSHMGLQARLMSQALRKIGGKVASAKSTVIFTNQTRDKLGVMYGNPETTPGGKALKFWASVRIRCATSKITTGPLAGNAIEQRFDIKKNKVAPPFKKASVNLIWGQGYDSFGILMDAGENYNIVTKSGAWYYMGDYKWQRDSFVNFQEEVTNEIMRVVHEDMEFKEVVLGPEGDGEEAEPTDEFNPEEFV